MKEASHYLTPILIQLYNSTLSHLEKMEKHIFNCCINKKMKIQQFQTITLGASRGMGHTQAIISLIDDKKLNAIYICENINMGNLFKKQLKEKSNANVKTYGSYSDTFLNNINSDLSAGDIDIVIVESSTISQNKRDQIVDIICESSSNPILLRIQPRF